MSIAYERVKAWRLKKQSDDMIAYRAMRAEDAREWRKRYPGKALLANKRNYALRSAYYKTHARKWESENREHVLERERIYRKSKRDSDPLIKIRTNLRTRLNRAIAAQYKKGSAVRDLGCSIAELKTRLESQWLPGMSWANYGRGGWHIDHIRPLSLFDLTEREQVLVACHYTNLQPLWAADNIIKRNHESSC